MPATTDIKPRLRHCACGRVITRVELWIRRCGPYYGKERAKLPQQLRLFELTSGTAA
jgi:hypothetical protein